MKSLKRYLNTAVTQEKNITLSRWAEREEDKEVHDNIRNYEIKEIQDRKVVILQKSSNLMNKEFADLIKQKANNSKDAASFLSRAKVLKHKSVEQHH